MTCGGGELHGKVAREVKHLRSEPNMKKKRWKAGSLVTPSAGK
jgi:hypothetical protein